MEEQHNGIYRHSAHRRSSVLVFLCVFPLSLSFNFVYLVRCACVLHCIVRRCALLVCRAFVYRLCRYQSVQLSRSFILSWPLHNAHAMNVIDPIHFLHFIFPLEFHRIALCHCTSSRRHELRDSEYLCAVDTSNRLSEIPSHTEHTHSHAHARPLPTDCRRPKMTFAFVHKPANFAFCFSNHFRFNFVAKEYRFRFDWMAMDIEQKTAQKHNKMKRIAVFCLCDRHN